MNNDKKLKYMNVVISGASKGIGRALALKFVQAGCNVAISARGKEALNVLAVELSNIRKDVKIITVVADMSIKEDVLKFAEEINIHFSSVDILINNAGVFIPGAIHNEIEGNLEKMIDTNLYSAYHLTRALLPDMIKRKQGFVFNVCSIASFTAYSNGGSYAISKFAMLGFSKCLREELKPHGIRVCAVMPGATYTESWKGVDLPEERFIPAEDIAEIIFATSNLSQRTVVEDIVIRPLSGDL